MIKLCDDAVVEPLSLIFEKCIETGIYPSSWKKANVVPIHKKGSRQSKNNYHPISLLPIFSKLFGEQLFDVIYHHLCENQFLTSNQSGFRPGDSTINQLLLITHKIHCAFDDIHQVKKHVQYSLSYRRHLIEYGMKDLFTSLDAMEYLVICLHLLGIF